jgi:hypothetical protein
MRIINPTVNEEDIYDWARNNDFGLAEYNTDPKEVLEFIDADLAEFGLEIVRISDEASPDYYLFKVAPRGILEATKWNLEKGVPYI